MAAGGGGGSDYLYKVGVDTSQATAQLRDFASKTAPGLLADIPAMQIKVGYQAAMTNVTNFVNRAKAQLDGIPAINMKISFKGASQSLNAFMNTFGKQAANLEAFQARLDGLNRSAAQAQGVFGGLAGSFKGVTENIGGVGKATETVVAGTQRVTESAQKAGNAFDYLGKMANYTMFKFVEWQVMIQGVNAVWNGFTNSLQQAGEVQLEKILQSLYSLTGASIDVNAALSNATVIAKQWGGNIVDIQQAIGLWTKNTHDLAAATVLANEGEKLARASGVSTLEVYRDSIAIGAQMGITYKQLPAVYDQITRAALHLAEPLRAVNQRAGEGQEAIKDLINGLAEASATLGSNGFSGELKGTAAIIAMVSNQITAMGESGKNAARNLSTMFGALSQGGPKRKEYESILGADAFSNVDKLLESMQVHMKDLMQAQADGKLGVRPAQVETLATMLKTLKNIDETYKDISAHSKGMLDIAATAEMQSFTAQVDVMKASLQAFEIEIGTRLLPTLQGWVNFMAVSGIPTVQHWVPTIIDLGQKAAILGASFLALQGVFKGMQIIDTLRATFLSFSDGLRRTAEAEQAARASGFETSAAMEALQGRVTALDAAFARDAEETALIAEAWRKLGTDAGLTAEQLSRLSAAELEAGESAQTLRTEQIAAGEALLKEADDAGVARTELFAYATAEERAALQAVALRDNVNAAADAGVASVAKWQIAANGILGIAGAALRTLGPLAAMYAALQVAQSAGENLSKEGTQINSITQQLKQGNMSTIGANGAFAAGAPMPGLFQSGGLIDKAMYGLKDIVADATGNAQYGDFNHLSTLESNIQRSPQFGQQWKDLAANLGSARASGNVQKANEIADEMGKIAQDYLDQEKYASKSKEYQALIAKSLQSGQQALGHQMGAPEMPHVFANVPAKSTGGGANPYTTQLNESTDAYNALVKQKDALIARDQIEIKTNETLMSLYGNQPKFVNAAAGAYSDEIKQLEGIVTATKAHIATLTTEVANYKNAGSTSKQKAQAQAAELKAENELVTAQGTLAESEAKVKQAEADRADVLSKLTLKADLYKAGITDLTTQLKQMSDNLQQLKGHDSEQLVMANQAVATLEKWQAALQAELSKYPPLSQAHKNLVADLAAVGEALKTDKALVTSDTDGVIKLTESISKAIEELEKSNFDTLGGILGINKQTISYVDQMLAGMQQLEQTQQQINKDRTTADAAQQALLNTEQAELNLRKQLLPIEQQILQIRSSPLYQAWNSEIDKMGSTFFDKIIGKDLFGTGGQNGMLGIVHQFFSGIGQDLMKSMWSNFSQNLTTSIFGGSSQTQQLQATFNTLYADLQKEFQQYNSTATGPVTTSANTNLQAAQLMLKASQNYMQATSTGTGTGTGNPNGSLINQNVDPYAAFDAYDNYYQVNSNSDVGQSYTSANTTAENTTTMVDSLNNIDTTLTGMQSDSINQWAQVSGLFDAGNGGGSISLPGVSGGGGGFLSSLLGSLGFGAGAAGGGAGGAGGIAGLLSSPAGILTAATGIGSLFGGILGSNTGKAGTAGREENGMFGALGGAGAIELAGMFLGGPPGWGLLLASILGGGLIGSLFGDHFPISNEPDIGEPNVDGVNYGQFVANMNGSPGSFNGKTMDPFSQYQGVDREAVQLEQDVQKVLNNPNASPQLKSLAKQLQALNPGNEPEGFSILSEKNDVFTLHSGAAVNVEQYMGLVQQFMQLYGKQQQAPLAPIISVNGGAGFNPYNTPGLTNSEFGSMTAAYSYMAQNGSGGTSAYSTPGVGGGAPLGMYSGRGFGPSGAAGAGGSGGNVTVQLMVDGKVIAQIVNAYNAQYLLNSGKSIDQVPVLQ